MSCTFKVYENKLPSVYLPWIQDLVVLWRPPCCCAPQGRHNSSCVPLLRHGHSHWLFHYFHSSKSVPSTSVTRRTFWRQPQSVGAAKAANNGWRWNWSQSLCRLPVYSNGFVIWFLAASTQYTEQLIHKFLVINVLYPSIHPSIKAAEGSYDSSNE